jgi:hypothetical protein
MVKQARRRHVLAQHQSRQNTVNGNGLFSDVQNCTYIVQGLLTDYQGGITASAQSAVLGPEGREMKVSKKY